MQDVARRVLPLRARGPRPAQRRRRRRGLPARGRPGDHADRLQGGVEEALRGGLEVDRRRRRATAARARRARCRCSSRRCSRGVEHGVQHVPGPRATARPRSSSTFGTPEQKALYCEQHVQRQVGRHDVPHRAAGRLATSARRRTTATRNADGSYDIRGTKIFISGGDHDLAENIVHLVLARVDGAPAGTKGLTLFIVPKLRIDARRHARRAERRRRRRASSTRWASTARRPACSTSARTATASASPSAATPS